MQNIAETLLSKNKVAEAQKFAERSLKISNELGYPDNIKRSSNVLSKIYFKTGNWNRAFKMQVLFKQMNDSINNEANRKNSIQKGFQYEYDKKVTTDSVKASQERNVFNAQLKQEKTQRFALYGGILLVALFGLLFSSHSIELLSGDTLYLYTDGFADQFGGPKEKKYKYKKLNELLLSFSSTSLKEQKESLGSEFDIWKGIQEQVDDVLIIGIQI